MTGKEPFDVVQAALYVKDEYVESEEKIQYQSSLNWIASMTLS